MAAIPSPADQPEFSARSLLTMIVREGGHLFRMRERMVFTITQNAELAQRLITLGGLPYLPQDRAAPDAEVRGGFRDAPGGPMKWDIYVHTIPVRGEQTIWEAAERRPDVSLTTVEESA